MTWTGVSVLLAQREREQKSMGCVYRLHCNRARRVTHSQAVKTDEPLGSAQPGPACLQLKAAVTPGPRAVTGSQRRSSEKWDKS